MMERVIVALFNSIGILLIVVFVGFLLQQLKLEFQKICCTFFGNTLGNLITNRLTFIGTVHHELSHALLATLTGAKVTEVHLFKFSGDTLGEVKFVPRGKKTFQNIQFCLAALAPSICGLITLTLMVMYFNNSGKTFVMWQWILLIYIEISIFLHMTLSKIDIEMASKGMPTVMLIIFIVFFITKFNLIEIIQNMIQINPNI